MSQSGGLPSFSLVGLPDPAVRESRERVRSALVNSGFKFPMHRITANLAPADLRKAGPGFDLAIAAALLAASGQLPPERLGRVALAGELALDGSIRPVPGVLAMAEAARELDAEAIAVPAPNAPEAALAGEPRVVPLVRLEQLALLGTEDEPLAPQRPDLERERRRARGAGPRRSAGTAVPPVRPGGGGCRRSQPPDHRPARRRQVARRAPPAVDHAPAGPLRGDGGAADRERLRPVPGPGRSADATLQGSPPHDLDRRAGGWRLAAPGRRGDALPPRGAVPRRAGGVLAARRSRRCDSPWRRAG